MLAKICAVKDQIRNIREQIKSEDKKYIKLQPCLKVNCQNYISYTKGRINMVNKIIEKVAFPAEGLITQHLVLLLTGLRIFTSLFH